VVRQDICYRLLGHPQLYALFNNSHAAAAAAAAAVLSCLQMPDTYPHFMERKDRQSYQSTKVLGLMYDRVLAHPVTKHLLEADAAAVLAANNATNSSSSSARQQQLQMRWPEQLLQAAEISRSWAQLVSAAEQDFAVFDRELVALMNHWGVYNLGECCHLETPLNYLCSFGRC
jgi:hypothetical protein